VGDGVAWVTDIRQAWAGPQTMLFAPKGPLLTVNSALTRPLVSAVTLCMLARLQSPGPVAVPFVAHCVTTRASPGEKPDACTITFWPDFSPVAGVTAACCAALPVAVGEGDIAGVVAVVADALAVGLRITGPALLPHPAARSTSTMAAAQRRGKATVLTCLLNTCRCPLRGC
jgi:hypothetical protein